MNIKMMSVQKIIVVLFTLFSMSAIAGCGGGGGSSSSSSTSGNSIAYSGTITFNNGTTASISFSAIPPTSTAAETIAYIFSGPNGTATIANAPVSVPGIGIAGNTVVNGASFSQNPLDSNGGLANITGTISGSTITGTVSDVQTSNTTTGDPVYPAFTGTYTATETTASDAIKAH